MQSTTVYSNREINAEDFNAHDARLYTGTLEEARDELQSWLDQGWVTTEPTDENTVEITAEDMQAAIREHLLHQ